MLSKYRYSEMPEVYAALNKLHSTEWVVNEKLLDVLSEAVGLSPINLTLIPGTISKEQRKTCLLYTSPSPRDS